MLRNSSHDDSSPARIEAALTALDLEQKVRLLTGAGFWRTHAEPAIGLREMVLSDGPAGVRGERFDERDPSALLPCPSAVAATWDVDLGRRLGRLLADEATAKGIDIVLGPTVNLHRSPYSGRHFECFSEDPLLTGRIGSAVASGIQSGGVAACVKHFVANDSETDRFTVDVQIDERTLREIYAAPFEAIMRESSPWSIMASYNSVNGTTMTQNELLDDLLRGQWGFDGLIVSDWFATRDAAASGTAGLDLAMPGPIGPWTTDLVAAVRDGRVTEKHIDAKVRNLLGLAERVGAIAGSDAAPRPVRQEDAAALLTEAVIASSVLLRNTGILPLRPEALDSIAVLGPNAAHPRLQGGGSATVHPPRSSSPLDGLREALGGSCRIVHAVGAPTRQRLTPLDPSRCTDPVDGRPGLRVRFTDASGATVHEEHRESARLLWLSDPVVAAATRVEVSTVVTIDQTGRYRLGIAGVGRFRLTLDEDVLFDQDLVTDDPLSGILNPGEHFVSADLTTGQRLRLRLDHVIEPDQIAIGFLVGLDEPAGPAEAELAHAVDLAARSDVAIVVVGTTEEQESEGSDRESLLLPGDQNELVRRVARSSDHTIVIVNAASPVVMPWREDVDAIVLTWFPGQEFGGALAAMLLGDAEPGGRLPTTWPATEDQSPIRSPQPVEGRLDYRDDLHIGHRRWAASGEKPAYAFGHGLGYTTWELGAVNAPRLTAPESSVLVTVPVHNTGQRHGRVVVQAYMSRPESDVERPATWLAGFGAVDLAAGQRADVSVAIDARAFAHWDDGWQFEPGTFEIRAGVSSDRLGEPVQLRVRS